MERWTSRLAITAALAALAAAAHAADAPLIPRSEETLTLEQAVAEGKVEVNVSSLGGATGSTIKVEVRRKVPRTLYVRVTPGTVFLSVSGKVQNMTGGTIKGEYFGAQALRPDSVMVLVDGRVRTFVVESFCLDYHKPAPRRGDPFSIARLDQRAMRILQPPEGLQPSLWAFQCAIWIDRAGVAEVELRRRFRVSDADLAAARALLRHAQQAGVASIPAGLAPEVRVQVERLFVPDPSVRAEAVAALGRLGEKALPAIPLVQVNVDVENPGRWSPAAMPPVPATTREAADALARLGLPELEPLIQGLSIDIRGNLPAGIVPPLPRVGPTIVPGAAPGGVLADHFIASLKHPSALVRQRAARMLGLSRQPRIVPPLIEALGDQDAAVRQAAADALKQATGQDFGTDAAKWSEWWEKNKDTLAPTGP
jgi:hypothetical protein